MSRYIDAEQVRMAKVPYDNELTEYDLGWNDACEAIADNAKTADVIEVVRCKDCRHLEVLNGDTYYARCKWHGRLFGSFGRADTRTWFCADGERREDE